MENPNSDEKFVVTLISVLNGREFRYPILSPWLERFLET